MSSTSPVIWIPGRVPQSPNFGRRSTTRNDKTQLRQSLARNRQYDICEPESCIDIWRIVHRTGEHDSRSGARRGLRTEEIDVNAVRHDLYLRPRRVVTDPCSLCFGDGHHTIE